MGRNALFFIDRFCFFKSVSTTTAIEGLLRRLGGSKTLSDDAYVFLIVSGRVFSYAIKSVSSTIKLINFWRRERD